MARSSPAIVKRARRSVGEILAGPAQGWASAHARCLLESLGRLYRRWLASLLTTAVIGIALALPTGLHVLMNNLDTLSQSWQRAIQASLYLDDDLSLEAGRTLATRLDERDDIDSSRYISADEGLEAFRESSGFGAALDALQANPLPAVIVITPEPGMARAAVGQLLIAMEDIDGVDRAELDQAWLQRLYAILAVLQRAAWVIGLLLSVAVLFIVGNTIRLDIENRREEIEVMKLLGASNAFIRRPFLYSGFWYGLIGAVVALLTLGLCFLALARPLTALTRSYEGALDLSGLGLSGMLAVLLVGIGLGWVGSALTVNRELSAIEPR